MIVLCFVCGPQNVTLEIRINRLLLELYGELLYDHHQCFEVLERILL